MRLNDSQANAECAQWYLIQCKGGESFRAAEQLENQGYQGFHPTRTAKAPRNRSSRLTCLLSLIKWRAIGDPSALRGACCAW